MNSKVCVNSWRWVSIPNGKPGPLRLGSDTAEASAGGTFQSQTGSQALSDADMTWQQMSMAPVSIPNGKPGPLRPRRISRNRVDIVASFNPKREARPSQTSVVLYADRIEARGFNPKREARPSQTPTSSTLAWTRPAVSIPNGKPGPLRPLRKIRPRSPGLCFNPKREARPSQTEVAVKGVAQQMRVSIPNGKPGPLRHENFFGADTDSVKFQSQTGSQALSDAYFRYADTTSSFVSIPNGKPGPLRLMVTIKHGATCLSFNPKREARPSQTLIGSTHRIFMLLFQSQTGSQALSDRGMSEYNMKILCVSIPNGKPGPLRRRMLPQLREVMVRVSIPNGKPGPLRLRSKPASQQGTCRFNPKREARPSQTDSKRTREGANSQVSIPNGKPGPLRQ